MHKVFILKPCSIRQALEAEETLNALDADGLALVHWAALLERVDVLCVLLELGAGVDTRDALGRTALMHAALAGTLAAVELLLAQGTDAAARDADGETVLMYAAKSGCLAVVLKLLALSADINAVDARGRTAINWHVRNNPVHEIYDALVLAGADPSLADTNGLNATDAAKALGVAFARGNP